VRPGYEVITDSGEVPSRIRRLSAQTVIIDVEPFIATWDSSQQELDQGIARVLDQIKDIPGVRVVCFATNSARLPSVLPESPAGLRVEYQASARKPSLTAAYDGLPRPGVVVGDQIATDGILARRLRFRFLHVQQDLRSMPAGPMLLAAAGQLMRPLVFGFKERS
jgi:predicted HAD superfamily phosphohydrolase YqeG